MLVVYLTLQGITYMAAAFFRGAFDGSVDEFKTGLIEKDTPKRWHLAYFIQKTST